MRRPGDDGAPAEGVTFLEAPPPRPASRVVVRFTGDPDAPAVTVVAWSVREFFQKLVDAERLYFL